MNDYVYFAFIDVLGYKSYLEEDIRNNSLDFKDRLQSAFQVFNDVNGANYGHKSISDSIFLHCNAEDPNDFFKLLKKIFVSFVEKEILIRGGVSYNRHFENQQITYSLALTDAYKLESSAAIFPRILIHPSIIEKLRNHRQEGGAFLDDIVAANLLLQDGNATQLHVLDDENWTRVYKGCKQIYEKSKSLIDADCQLRLKHVWLQNYLFKFKPKNKHNSKYIAEFSEFTI
ncbi:hypothetical protein [Methylobacillus sp. MM3]|jgi:hypothetical protein|uniref:hypothetical protein n=1 Tax=Methylobacillus sp. MM3 TaxID=1848039 RepID=UPI0010422447|nr:hypothetical protein [Methylobacillus sp. MM3]